MICKNVTATVAMAAKYKIASHAESGMAATRPTSGAAHSQLRSAMGRYCIMAIEETLYSLAISPKYTMYTAYVTAVISTSTSPIDTAAKPSRKVIITSPTSASSAATYTMRCNWWRQNTRAMSGVNTTDNPVINAAFEALLKSIPIV